MKKIALLAVLVSVSFSSCETINRHIDDFNNTADKAQESIDRVNTVKATATDIVSSSSN